MTSESTEEATVEAIVTHVETYAQLLRYDIDKSKVITTDHHERLMIEVRCRTSKITVVVLKSRKLYNLFNYGYVRVSLVLNPRDARTKHRIKVTPDSFKTLVENAFDEFDEEEDDDNDF